MERDIMEGLTAEQFRDWEMYNEIDPFTEVRDDYRIATIVQMLYNVNRGKNDKVLELKDFVLTWKEDEGQQKKAVVLAPATGRTQTLEEQQAILAALAAMHTNDTPGRKVEGL